MTAFELGTRYVIDETEGLQNGAGGDADVLFTSLPSAFRTYLDTLGQSYSFATSNGVARSATGAIQITGTNTVSALILADSNNEALDGDDSGILTLAGNHVFLYATDDPHIVIGREGNGAVANPNGEVVFAVYLEAAANNLSATLWTIQYEAIQNPDSGSNDEVVDLGNSLHIGAAGDFALDFGTLASGQLLFGSFGNSTLAVIVAGRDQALPSIDSVNTSQGGGGITIGVNNQMFNPGEAAYFTFVEGLQPTSGTTMPATGANQPGGVSAIDYTALHTSISASFTIVQIQGDGGDPHTNIQLHAFNTAMEETTAFLPGQGDADDVEVRIDPASVQVFLNGTQVTQGITVIQLAGGLGVDVRGVPVGATVRYSTVDSNGEPAAHTRLLIENVDSSPFDIGGFSLGGPPTFTSIGQLVGFGDDGPTAAAALIGTLAVADESTGTNGADLGLALPNDEVGHSVTLANGARLIGWDQAVMVTTTGTALGSDGGASSVTLTLGANADSGLTTTDGTAILLTLESGVVVGRANGEAIFAIGIDAGGQVTVEQYDSIRHSPVAGFDTLASIAAGRVFATVTATDGDADSASSSVDIGSSIGFEDDGPSATLTLNAVSLVVDESVGVDAGDPNAADEVGHGVDVIGWAQLSGEALFTTSRDYGEDEEGATSAYSLRIQSALTTMSVSNTNSAISLVQDGSTAVRGVSADGQYAFRVEIDAVSGQVTFTQFVAIEHGDTGSVDELSAALGSGLLYAVWTVTDGDIDSVAPEVDLGSIIHIEDDGPTASIALTGTLAVADESTGTNGADLGLAAPDDEVGHSVSLANGTRLIGWDQAVMVTTTGTALGSDGGASSVTLTLGANPDSGLTTTDGTAILLTLESGVVVGRANGEAIFAIGIDAGGQVTIEQYDSIRHTPTAGFDTLASIAAGRVFATVTATDNDGDATSSSADIGSSIGFEDDGPSASLTLNNVTIVVDESVGVDAGDPNAADETGQGAGVIGWAQLSGEALFTTTRDYGEDEEGATSAYSLRIQSALTTMSVSNTNSAISLVQDGSTAVRGVSADGQYAFRVEIDAVSGQVTFTQFVAIEHGNTGSVDELSAALGSGLLYAVWTVTDGDSDSVAPEVDLGSIIHIEDDGPTASIALTGTLAVADESTGTNGADLGLAAPNDEDGHSVTLADGARLIGWDQAVMVTTTGTALGSDGGASSVTLTLGANADSGLTTTDGTAILLTLESGVVVGRANGEAIFAIAIDAGGQVTIEQYDSIRHTPTAGFDTLASIAAGRVFATVTATDGDADSASSSVDIGSSIGFEDDGPSATLTLNAVSLVVDESVGVDAGDPNAADEVGHGVDVIGWAQLSGEALFTTTRDYGEDEEGGTSVFSLRIQTAQTALRVSNTNSLIALVQDGDNAVRGVSADGQYAFRVEIDPTSGQVTFTQFIAIEHGDTTNDDELSAGLGSNLLYAVWTVTDGDSDAAAPEVDLGSIMRIEDDGPTLDPTTFDDLTVGNVVGTTVSDNVVDFDPGSDDTSTWRIADAPGEQGTGTSGFTWRYVDSTGDGVADANSVVGSLNGVDLYSMFIDDDGTYDFTLLSAIKANNLRLDISDIKAGGPDTNFIEVGALNSDSFVRISGYRDPDGSGPLDPVAAAVNESNANVGVVNGNLDANETLVFQLYAPDGADADTLPDLQVISGISIGTKTPKATTYTYTAFLNGVEVGGMIDVSITTGKNGMLVINAPPGVFFDTIEITSVNGNAVKIGLGDISIRIQPSDQLLGFTFELGDGDSDPTSTAVTVGIDGNGDGVVSGVTTTFAAPVETHSDLMMMGHLRNVLDYSAVIESHLIQLV